MVRSECEEETSEKLSIIFVDNGVAHSVDRL